jgi:hypothetical protein
MKGDRSPLQSSLKSYLNLQLSRDNSIQEKQGDLSSTARLQWTLTQTNQDHHPYGSVVKTGKNLHGYF